VKSDAGADPAGPQRGKAAIHGQTIRRGALSTDIEKVLTDPDVEVYFDAQLTQLRAEWVAKAIRAGKNVYCEKPLAPDSKTAFALAELASKSGLKCGIVQDKLFLPACSNSSR